MNGINVNEHLLDGPNDYIKIKPNPLSSYTKSCVLILRIEVYVSAACSHTLRVERQSLGKGWRRVNLVEDAARVHTAWRTNRADADLE